MALLGAAGYLSLCAWRWPYTMDDAFISFRYAKHIGDGIGPIWNLADRAHPIEGFTAFLYVWLLGGIRFLTGSDLVVPAKLLGITLGLVLAAGVLRAAHRYHLRGTATAAALSFLIVPAMVMNAVSGMETTLFMLWNWLCAMACVRLLEQPTARTPWAFVLFGLLGTFTRPEFAAAFLVMAAHAWWQRPPLRRALLPALAILYVLPGIAVTAWRYAFYGNLVPYPFYAKQAAGPSPAGLSYVGYFLALGALPYLLLIASGARSLWNEHRHLLLVVGLNAITACAYFSTTKPLMGWWFRFLLPQIPLLAFCAGVALNHRARGSALFWRTAGGLVMLFITIAYVPVASRFVMLHKAGEDRYREVGRRLRPFRSEDRWLLYYDVGSIVYESEWNTLDEVSLNTDRKWRQEPCVTRKDVVLRITSSRQEIVNPCPGLYAPLADLPFISQPPGQRTYMRVFARQDISYGGQLGTHLLDGWPAEFVAPVDVVVRHPTLFSLFVIR